MALDWGAIVAGIASGASGVYTIQKVIARVRRKPAHTPIVNGERSELLAELRALAAEHREQNRSLGRLHGELRSLDQRLMILENAVAALQGQGPTTPRSTEQSA